MLHADVKDLEKLLASDVDAMAHLADITLSAKPVDLDALMKEVSIASTGGNAREKTLQIR